MPIQRLSKGDRARTMTVTAVANEVIDAVNAARNIIVDIEGGTAQVFPEQKNTRIKIKVTSPLTGGSGLTPPATDGVFQLLAVRVDGVTTYAWVEVVGVDLTYCEEGESVTRTFYRVA